MKKKKFKLPKYFYDEELGKIEIPQEGMSEAKKKALREDLKKRIDYIENLNSQKPKKTK